MSFGRARCPNDLAPAARLLAGGSAAVAEVPEELGDGLGTEDHLVVVLGVVQRQCDRTGGEALGTVLLAEYDGTTIVTMSVVYSSRQARDGALKSGMKDGVVSSYAKLDALLAELSRAQNAA